MERLRRLPEPAAIDITWVSCRGVRSSLPFHTPCLYASIFVVSSSAKNARRHHRVKTPTDRAGGENPEWDAPLRLYLPDASPTEPEAAAGGKNRKDGGDDSSSSSGNDDAGVLLLKFELKAEVAVLGDVHTASAAVPVPDLVADGRTRRVSYQLVGPDGRQPNGVVSFSYAIHERNSDDGLSLSLSLSDSEPATPPCCHTPAASAAVALPLPAVAAAAPRLYPEMEWTLTEQPPPVLPPVTMAMPFAAAETQYYYTPAAAPPQPTPAHPVEPTSVYPPAPPASSVYPPALEPSFCSVYPTVVVEKASALYPTLDIITPVSYYPPSTPAYGVECGYAAAPGWGDRCLYG